MDYSSKTDFLILCRFKQFSLKYDRNSTSHSDEFLITLLKQVCEWYDFVFEIVTSRAIACLFRSKSINNTVFIQIYFANFSLISSSFSIKSNSMFDSGYCLGYKLGKKIWWQITYESQRSVTFYYTSVLMLKWTKTVTQYLLFHLKRIGSICVL